MTAGIKIHWLLIVVNEVHNVLKSVYLDMLWSTQSTCHVAHTSRRGTRTIANLTSTPLLAACGTPMFFELLDLDNPWTQTIVTKFLYFRCIRFGSILTCNCSYYCIDDTSINQQPTKKPLSEVMVTNTTNNLSCVHWHHDTQKWECISSWYISMERIVHHQDLQLQILRKQEQEPSL